MRRVSYLRLPASGQESRAHSIVIPICRLTDEGSVVESRFLDCAEYRFTRNDRGVNERVCHIIT